jgi:hypothetical protein
MASQPEQLDIFAHSRDVMLRNDVLDALQKRDATRARSAWRELAEAFPQDADLPALAHLTHVLEQHDDTALPDHDALTRERHALVEATAPAARQAFGAAAGEAWLLPLWQAVAARCAGLPYRGGRADDHAAALWLRGGHWAAAARAVETIESWRRIPVPLAWMAEARCRLDGLDDCWPLLTELAWLAPKLLDALLRRLDDPLLARLRQKFEAGFDGTGDVADLAWFPAWVLTHTPALAPHLARAQPSLHGTPEQGMRLLLELLGLERQGRHHELVQRRRALRDLHAGLYAAYMETR